MDIIFDIDGVLADCSHRLPFIKNGQKDWNAFYSPEEMMKDEPIEAGIDLFRSLDARDDMALWLVTGRPERTRDATAKWLKKYDINCVSYIPLLMRDDGDHRPAHMIKREHVELTKAKLAIDDDLKNCRMYVELGVPAMLFMSKHSSLWDVDAKSR